MSKRVVIAIDFDYDRDHRNDLMDVIQVSQVWSELDPEESHEQSFFLLNDTAWRESFSDAVITALTGAPTHFGSEDN